MKRKAASLPRIPNSSVEQTFLSAFCPTVNQLKRRQECPRHGAPAGDRQDARPPPGYKCLATPNRPRFNRYVDIATQRSLLARLKTEPSEADWERFYNKYSAVIVSFARRQGLDDDSALDVLQETMMVMMRKLPAFEYDPERGRFRNWLLTVVVNKARNAVRRAHADRMLSLDADTHGEDASPLLDKLASDGATADAQLDAGWRQSLLEEALHRLLTDSRTQADTIAVFRAVALEGQPAAEVAAEHDMKENAVYQIKNRLLTRLQAMVAEMEKGGLRDD